MLIMIMPQMKLGDKDEGGRAKLREKTLELTIVTLMSLGPSIRSVLLSVDGSGVEGFQDLKLFFVLDFQ